MSAVMGVGFVDFEPPAQVYPGRLVLRLRRSPGVLDVGEATDEQLLDLVAAQCSGLYGRAGDELEEVRVPAGYGRHVRLDREFGRLVGLPWCRSARQAAYVAFAGADGRLVHGALEAAAHAITDRGAQR
jgi:hypothetical protein